MTKHIQNVHEGKRDYKCEFCGKLFTQKGTLKSHIGFIHEMSKKEHKCGYCGKSCGSKRYMKIHIDVVHEGKTYDCDTCGKSFATEGVLNKHKLKVQGTVL